MKKRNAMRAVTVGLLATLGTTLAAEAGGRSGGHHVSSMPSRGSSFRGHGFGHHRFPAHHFVPFTTVVIAPPAFYGSPLYAPPPTYYSPPLAYPAPPPSASASVYSSVVTVPAPAYNAPVYAPPAYAPPTSAPTPPMPRVVEFPSGRYELRGDGIATPHTWVWIPNPPTAPPATPPTAAPTSGDGVSASRPQIYTWVDKQGVEHWTNRSDKVPGQLSR